MDRFTGLIGVIIILGIAFLLSNNKKAIDYRVVISGLAIQLLLAVFILKVELGQVIFAKLGFLITKLLDYSNKGAEFVFGVLVNGPALQKVFGPGSDFIF